jgi:hypothetical protein
VVVLVAPVVVVQRARHRKLHLLRHRPQRRYLSSLHNKLLRLNLLKLLFNKLKHLKLLLLLFNRCKLVRLKVLLKHRHLRITL